jgi:hypothetical protein
MHRILRPDGQVALSHWCGPDASSFFRVVFGGLAAHADMGVVPAAPPPFALSSPEALEEALVGAGFTDVTVRKAPLVFEAPGDSFSDHFRAFAVRGSMILERQAPDRRAQIDAAWAEGFAPFIRDGLLRVPMPALLANGRKG